MRLVRLQHQPETSVNSPKVYPNWVPSPSLTEAAATSTASTPYLTGPDRTKGEAMLADWMARRARHMYSHPHVRKSFSSILLFRLFRGGKQRTHTQEH